MGQNGFDGYDPTKHKDYQPETFQVGAPKNPLYAEIDRPQTVRTGNFIA